MSRDNQGADVLLQAREICKSYGSRRARKQVLFDVSLELRAGECLAVIGSSGSGKSTLSRILLGMEQPDRGDVLFEGVSVVENPAQRVRLHRESSVVYQQPFDSLDPRWTVERSVGEPLRLAKMPAADVAERVCEALREVQLDPAVVASRYPIDLSGGQAQRVAIARALAIAPKIMLADEAMSAIDVAARVQILEVLRSVRERNPRMGMVMVSHDLGVVQHIADKIAVLDAGHVVEFGSVEQVLRSPNHEVTRRLVEAATW